VSSGVQDLEGSDGVDCTAPQVPRTRDTTNRAIAKHRAAAGGKAKSRKSVEEEEHVSPCVLGESA
jgi:hypothetical protein